MALRWTYSGNPASSALDEVRFLTADTDSTKAWTLADDEINYAITLHSGASPTIGNNFLAAAVCAETIVAKLKSVPASKSVGDLSLSWGQQFQFYADRAYQLRQRAALKGVVPYISGTSRSEKQDADAEEDRVQPAAKVDGMSNLYPQDPLTGGY